ncbi:hypothetical protein ACFVTY_18160 [Streptomyces sp. NPDC058067]|uniref:hypothetical protein n=1 Tax=Streptomyces sp. NPDC058067 TaxID=3346324 RepID=UPI0036EE1663
MRSPAALARAEWGPLWSTVRTTLVTRKWRAVPLTLGAVLLTALFQYAQNQPWGYQFVQDVGSVRADDPLWLSLVRTPLSLFVPALDLPVWGALAQILIVFGVAEICLGRWTTLTLGYAATLAGTLYARVGIALGPDGPLGLTASDARIVDTGPSAAVVGLAVYVCWRHRARWTASLVVAVMVAEAVMRPNLAGKEHLAAIAAVLLAGTALLAGAVLRARSALRLRGAARHRVVERSGSGVPPMRSWKPRPIRAQRRSWR